jgi:hypothetical protein
MQRPRILPPDGGGAVYGFVRLVVTAIAAGSDRHDVPVVLHRYSGACPARLGSPFGVQLDLV